MFDYCSHCGWIGKQDAKHQCPVCSSTLKQIPAEYLSAGGNLFASQEAREHFIKNVIEMAPDFNSELALQRNEILQAHAQEHKDIVAKKVQAYQADKPVHKCPVCGSCKLSSISTVGKIAKISLLGVWGAGDIGKKWHCESCGHRF